MPSGLELRAVEIGLPSDRLLNFQILDTPSLGEAAEICMKEMDGEARRLKKLQDRMLKGLHARLPK